MNLEEYNAFTLDKTNGKDISKYLPKYSWRINDVKTKQKVLSK